MPVRPCLLQRPARLGVKRLLHSSALRHSYIGTTPIELSSEFPVTLKRDLDRKVVTVSGPLGVADVPCENYIRFVLPANQNLEKPGKKRNIAPPEWADSGNWHLSTQTSTSSSESTNSTDAITLYVASPQLKEQRMMWGTTRTLLSNAIVGQTTGYTIPIYLIGVGYRAAMEEIPTITSNASKAKDPSAPTHRLSLKLGFTRIIQIPIPPAIKVTVPSPTIINLFGTDKRKVGQFAADIRMWRPPEPYKGKGVFVGDEKIKMKVGKKK